ncbi:MAG: type II toxin-antitoxin system HipA family toxin [Terrimicrobiaceae bacterium]
MEKKLRVCWWDGSTVGHLIHRGTIYFVYDTEWLRRGLDLSPISLPFTDVAFNGAKGVNGLPGLIADCQPDAWGQKVARTVFAKNKWGEPGSMTLLAWRGVRGLGALNFQPVLETGETKLEAISAAALARGAAEIERGEPSEVLPQLARGGTAGGVWPKALVLAYDDGTLRVGEPDGTGMPCLLKFDPSETGENARCEHAYACMAQAAGIRMTESQLIEETPGLARRHLLLARFDVPSANQPRKRIHFHSASGMLHKEPDALDYRDLFRTAIRLHVAHEELCELARRMVFNVLTSNHDDHGKNHAFFLDEESGQWAMTPAYDLTYSSGLIQRGMQIAGEVWPKAATMEELCCGASLTKKEFDAVIEVVRSSVSRWTHWADESGLPGAKTKEIQSRLKRIQGEVFG